MAGKQQKDIILLTDHMYNTKALCKTLRKLWVRSTLKSIILLSKKYKQRVRCLVGTKQLV